MNPKLKHTAEQWIDTLGRASKFATGGVAFDHAHSANIIRDLLEQCRLLDEQLREAQQPKPVRRKKSNMRDIVILSIEQILLDSGQLPLHLSEMSDEKLLAVFESLVEQ